MTYLLDTNAISDLVGEQPRLTARIAALPGADRVCTCSIVRGEILHGLMRLPAGKRRTSLETKVTTILEALTCEPISPATADAYAAVKLTRQQAGLPLDDNDCWIAAAAIQLGATLISRDTDFQQIDGLRVEDWSV